MGFLIGESILLISAVIVTGVTIIACTRICQNLIETAETKKAPRLITTSLPPMLGAGGGYGGRGVARHSVRAGTCGVTHTGNLWFADVSYPCRELCRPVVTYLFAQQAWLSPGTGRSNIRQAMQPFEQIYLGTTDGFEIDGALSQLEILGIVSSQKDETGETYYLLYGPKEPSEVAMLRTYEAKTTSPKHVQIVLEELAKGSMKLEYLYYHCTGRIQLDALNNTLRELLESQRIHVDDKQHVCIGRGPQLA